MSCFMCYKAIEDGDLKKLKELQGNCQMFKGNQCSALPAEDSLGDMALNATVKVFPNFIKGKLPALCLLLFLSVTFLSISSAKDKPVTNNITATTSVETRGKTLSELTNRELLTYYNTYNDSEAAVAIVSRAENVAYEDLFKRSSEDYDLLIRLQGYVTSMQTDFLFGSYITIGETSTFSASDIYINFNDSYAKVGDEVIIFIIPVFSGYDTPLRSWEWTQIKNKKGAN